MNQLTVVVPLYNQEKYIKQCLESILNQTKYDMEVLVIDDGSTDNSYEICRAISQKDDRVQIIRQENKGLLGARRTGVWKCNTEYITFVDADDFILTDAYAYAQEAMDAHIDMIFFEIARYYDEGHVKREYHILREGFYDKERIRKEVYPKLIWDFDRNTPGVDCSQCIRIVKTALLREQYESIGGKRIYYGEDGVITYPLCTKINNMQVISKNYYMHRQRQQSIAPYIAADTFFDDIYNWYQSLLHSFEEEDLELFRKQIEYFYMYSVNLCKMKYNDYYYKRDFLFPFDRVANGKSIVLYGAGAVGQAYYSQLKKLRYCRDVLWVDKNADVIANADVKTVDSMQNFTYDFVVIAIENKNICQSVEKWLSSNGVKEDKIIY